MNEKSITEKQQVNFLAFGIKPHLPNQSTGKRGNSREIRKYFERSEKENTTHQNVWGIAKAALRGKGIALNASSKRSQINTHNV